MIATRYEDEINGAFLPSESLWLAVEPLLPDMKRKTGGKGRPAKSNRQMFFAMFYLLRTGWSLKVAAPLAWLRLYCP